MLTGEEVMEIRVLHRQGMSIRGIVRTTGVSRNVVRRYLRSLEAPRYKRRAPRASKLDPFTNYIAERLRAAAPKRDDGRGHRCYARARLSSRCRTALRAGCRQKLQRRVSWARISVSTFSSSQNSM
jgi:transposase